ncbi:HAD hydrolase-like protein [Tunicatimonas pelagia]|uniref:HAD hydrolase-like protein n=1 Tax=Tunicatimonas pelagia TaxID=931531 RepID=UPI002664FE25|nr:HAD hydrolase-like protein [Tunicatimonas pelagia]WKN45862.1 HAD hydrolase-like protein [Tunicatimonas pelagia]
MKTLIIDLDHTIFDPRTIRFQDIGHLFSVFAQQISPISQQEAQKDFFFLSTNNFIDKYSLDKSVLRLELERTKLDVKLDVLPFEDYTFVQRMKVRRVLLTSGITAFQNLKINSLGIKDDFAEICINDPLDNVPDGKLVVMQQLKNQTEDAENNLVVIGDNLEEEIKYGQSLGLRSILIDRVGNSESLYDCESISSFEELVL